jgi:hypothetical protein
VFTQVICYARSAVATPGKLSAHSAPCRSDLTPGPLVAHDGSSAKVKDLRHP